MFKARYYKADGKKGEARALPGSLFDGVVHEGALHQTVTAHMSNQRQGTASAKTRSEVRGGNRKPWRQKGTGRARHGTIRSPIWTGGGRAFPPIPRSWRVRVPKKVKALARRSAYNSRAADDRLVLIDRIEFEVPKTKRLLGLLEDIEATGKVLVLTEGRNQEVYLSARNLSGVEVRPFGEESAYDLLWAEHVVIERGAIEALEAEKPALEAEAGGTHDADASAKETHDA